jgi:hypothetical protein
VTSRDNGTDSNLGDINNDTDSNLVTSVMTLTLALSGRHLMCSVEIMITVALSGTPRIDGLSGKPGKMFLKSCSQEGKA